MLYNSLFTLGAPGSLFLAMHLGTCCPVSKQAGKSKG